MSHDAREHPHRAQHGARHLERAAPRRQSLRPREVVFCSCRVSSSYSFSSCFLDIGLEVGQQLFDGDKLIGALPVFVMAIIALASLVVITDESGTAATVKQRVFQAVGARGHRPRYAPNLDFNQGPIFKKYALTNEQRSIHMAYHAISVGMASSAIRST